MNTDTIHEQASQDNYGISRVDDEKNRTLAWRVKLTRHGRQLVKNFPDRKYGGITQALAQARLYRDELVKLNPPITRKEMCLRKRSNNKSGITGVCTYAKRYVRRDGSIKENWYWEASWPNEKNESVKAIFPVNKYGSELARQMAINARQKGIEALEGVFWRSEPGALIAAQTKPNAGIKRDEASQLQVPLLSRVS